MNQNIITIEELCKELGIGKTTAYKLIRTGEIPSGKIGAKIVIRRSELERYITQHTCSK